MYRNWAHRSQADTDTFRGHPSVSHFPVISGTVPSEERLTARTSRLLSVLRSMNPEQVPHTLLVPEPSQAIEKIPDRHHSWTAFGATRRGRFGECPRLQAAAAQITTRTPGIQCLERSQLVTAQRKHAAITFLPARIRAAQR
jgi:hypothetical protein